MQNQTSKDSPTPCKNIIRITLLLNTLSAFTVGRREGLKVVVAERIWTLR